MFLKLMVKLTLSLLAGASVGLAALTRPVGWQDQHLVFVLRPGGYIWWCEHHLVGTAKGTTLLLAPAEALVSHLIHLGAAYPGSKYIAAGT